jgi:hypothetical protein
VAPKGQPQSELTLRELSEALKDDQTAKNLEDRTGLTREQWEQYARKYEKTKSEPAGPGREIEVKPGDQPAAKPATDLPRLDRTQRFSTNSVRERGAIPQEKVRNSLVEGLRYEPPAEYRGKWEGYRSKLSRSRVTSGRPTARPKPAAGP